MKAVAVGTNSVLPLPGTCEGCSALPLHCPSTMSSAPSPLTHEHLPPLPAHSNHSFATEGGESRDNTGWEQKLCGEGGECKVNVMNLRSLTSRRRVTPQVTPQLLMHMMYGGNGAVILKAVTSQRD